jgi:ATP-dependent DNA helicase UvrD/PcrA
VTDPIVGEELELLGRVLEVLRNREAPDSSVEEGLVRELERVRALLISGEEQKDRVALLQQWDRGSALLRQIRSSRSATPVDPHSPYFAHLRLREAEAERDVCLGKGTCVKGEVRVVDWRHAPISRLFYRYRQGDPYEEEFGGRIARGQVAVRRTVAIRAGGLHRVDAPEGSFVREDGTWIRVQRSEPRLRGGEGAALRAHRLSEGAPTRRMGTAPGGEAQRVDKRLPDVAGLLDADQFELISRPKPGFLVVRGSAGSGKTTVALHRIAFLAYGDELVDSTRTLFLTLSPALRDYVSHVLPSLGVERVRVLTFQEWAADQRRRLHPKLPRAVREGTPDFVRRLKLHPAVGLALEEQVRRVPGPPTGAQSLDDWASVLSNPDLLEEVFTRRAAGALSAADLQRAAEWCRARHEEVLAYAGGDLDLAAELDAEDDALLLRAWQLRVGPLPTGPGHPLRYRHVAVDEVQDFSALELSVVLGCLDEPPSLTLAGDTQQHIAEYGGFASWSELFRWLGLPEPSVQTLRVTYRSSRPIMEFGRSVLGPLWEDEEVEAVRAGPPVEVFPFTDPGACVAFLAEALGELARDEPLASVAVLTPSRAASDLYSAGLSESDVPRLRQVCDQRFSFAPGVEVTEIEQAKGLEFDYVVLVDVSERSFPDTPSSRRLLHVGATRAIHQLWVTHAGPGSPLLRAS